LGYFNRLNMAKSNVYRLEEVHVTNTPRGLGLLKVFYDSLLTPTFAHCPEHMDELSVLEESIGIQSDPDTPDRLYVTLLVDADDNVCGGVLYELYGRSFSGLLSYVVVAPHLRGRGLGKQLLSTAVNYLRELCPKHTGKELEAVFLETEKSSAEEQNEKIVTTRLHLFKALGYRLLNLDYIQPSLGPEKPSAKNLVLLVYVPPPPEEKPTLSPHTLSAFLTEYALSCSSCDGQTCERQAKMLQRVRAAALKNEPWPLLDPVRALEPQFSS